MVATVTMKASTTVAAAAAAAAGTTASWKMPPGEVLLLGALPPILGPLPPPGVVLPGLPGPGEAAPIIRHPSLTRLNRLNVAMRHTPRPL